MARRGEQAGVGVKWRGESGGGREILQRKKQYYVLSLNPPINDLASVYYFLIQMIPFILMKTEFYKMQINNFQFA